MRYIETDNEWQLQAAEASRINMNYIQPEDLRRAEKRHIEETTASRDALAATYKKNAIMPGHYARFKIEPIRFLVENFGPVILVGKIVKYVMRYDAKNGLEDLLKAKRMLEMLIEKTKGNEDWWKAPTDAP
ncbi:DUF3310 domain-containing protein [Aestuariivirga sp. YIM B02566]|uniref:DUF3310 domain-containing protein n=1 Tax=Taklimakanibacter albus TaxID=2800327 RepID=A0ACC5RG30_9HYPH|nr:DUF3310 domain-containing protein [Aestuariivirga sp. YIM B02566]